MFPSASRSADYGSTYSKVNLAPGAAVVVTSFYICPTNKKKVGGASSSVVLESAVSTVTGSSSSKPGVFDDHVTLPHDPTHTHALTHAHPAPALPGGGASAGS